MRGPESEWVPGQILSWPPREGRVGFPFQVSQDISMLPGQATLIGPCSLFSEMRTVDLSVKNTQMLWDVLIAGWRKEFSKSDKTPRMWWVSCLTSGAMSLGEEIRAGDP